MWLGRSWLHIKSGVPPPGVCLFVDGLKMNVIVDNFLLIHTMSIASLKCLFFLLAFFYNCSAMLDIFSDVTEKNDLFIFTLLMTFTMLDTFALVIVKQ